jgi:exosortase
MNLSSRVVQVAAAVLGIALLWSYWPVLAGIVDRWNNDPKYSHGYIVPLFALWLLGRRFWQARHPGQEYNFPTTLQGLGLWLFAGIAEMFKALRDYAPGESGQATRSTGSWWGLALLAVSTGTHMAGRFFYIDSLSEVSLLPALAGLFLGVGGWRWLRLAGPSIGYLVFMLPLPYFVDVGLANSLQRFATIVCTYLLQTLGITASAEGNIIVVNSGSLQVADACSGLGMLVTFMALCTAIAIVMQRPLLDRLVVAVSAIPVAVLANVVRITLTGILFETVGRQVGYQLYHCPTGLLVMMPVALALVWLELKVLSHVLVEPPPQSPTGIGLNMGPAPAAAAANRTKNKPAIA